MEFKGNSKKLFTLLLALTLASPMILAVTIQGFNSGISSGGADYAVFEGVAGNDYYSSMQYSYLVNQYEFPNGTFTPANVTYTAIKALRVGMTEYGEFATPQDAGIAYGQNGTEWLKTESWASLGVSQKDWIQGWVLYINYTRQTKLRCLEAWALYSDFMTAEGGRKVYTWNGLYNSSDTLAQLTQGSLSTSGIKVVYDSGRLVEAKATVTVHDAVYNEDVCQLTFTLVFNKDSKYAIVYKDYKTLLDPKDLDNINDFAFSERYELDIAKGVNPANTAYIHYYHNYAASDYQHPLTGTYDYDVVQAFDPAKQYIYFAGYWPNATEYSVYSPLVPDPVNGYTYVLPSGFARPDIPAPANEPNTPWVVVQWRYNSTFWPNMLKWLAKQGYPATPGVIGFPSTNQREIRFVESFGMTDYNKGTGYQYGTPGPSGTGPALDVNAGDGANQVDAEVDYMLNGKVFVPDEIPNMVGEPGADPFMWIGLGQSSATTDSAGAGLVSTIPLVTNDLYAQPFMLFDRNDTLFPWTWTGGVTMQGTIPYGLEAFTGNYYEQFSNTGKGTGNDPTVYTRTALKGFAFGTYDGEVTSPPQPIAGGWDIDGDQWYPSKDPLTERWSGTTSFTRDMYDHITSSPNGIMTLGGMKANGLTRYFNDFSYAISREGTSAYALINGGTVTNSAPTSDFNKNTFDYFPVSTWNSTQTTFGYTEGYAVISAARDINGTRGLEIYGWNGRDTFWAAAWASQYLGNILNVKQWIPEGTVAMILHIIYTGPNNEPTDFRIVRLLGTITELGTDAFATTAGYGFDTENGARPVVPAWEATTSFLVNLPQYPTIHSGETYNNVWWYEKLNTHSDALVEFDG